jgi:hypothetical protein
MSSTGESIAQLIAAALEETYRGAGQTDVSSRLRDFRREHACDLRWLRERYTGDPLLGPITELPELAQILERLEHDPTGLRTHWPHELPREWLETLAELWGAPL